MKTCFVSAELQWKYVCVICTDRAPSMMESHSGFQKNVQELAPEAKCKHLCHSQMCAFQQNFAYTSENLLDSTISITDCIKSRSLNTCLLKELCKDMNSAHEVLFHTSVRSLSKGNVLTAFLRLRTK